MSSKNAEAAYDGSIGIWQWPSVESSCIQGVHRGPKFVGPGIQSQKKKKKQRGQQRNNQWHVARTERDC
jgi:hypothetical protein